MIIGLLTDIFGTLCTGLGLRSTDPNKKYKYYRVAIYALLVARKFLSAVKMQNLISSAIEIMAFCVTNAIKAFKGSIVKDLTYSGIALKKGYLNLYLGIWQHGETIYLY